MTGPGSYNKFTKEVRRLRVKQFKSAHKAMGTSGTEFAKSIGTDQDSLYKWCREFGVKVK